MDFGCGVGRTLMHFREEAELGEIWGVDLDAGALRTVEQNLCPPVKALRCENRSAVTVRGLFVRPDLGDLGLDAPD